MPSAVIAYIINFLSLRLSHQFIFLCMHVCLCVETTVFPVPEGGEKPSSVGPYLATPPNSSSACPAQSLRTLFFESSTFASICFSVYVCVETPVFPAQHRTPRVVCHNLGQLVVDRRSLLVPRRIPHEPQHGRRGHRANRRVADGL